ncbi:MAG: GWxTD domain-containing protein, partial [Melioribacteraceae bacterium]|nr:GWxTD domain-containing protein [Melioribacteraceae bacterium]
LIARFEDSDSKEAFKYEGPVSLPSFSDRISMSDILLIKEIVKKDDAETIIPNVTRIVSNADSVLSFFYEIYSDLDGGILAEYKIFDKGRDKNNTQIEQIQLKKGVNPITYTFSDTDFRLGDFELHIVLKSESEKAIAQKTKKFRSKIRGFPNIIKDLEKAIDQMVYIASVDEQDHILEPASYEERLNRFIEYWKAKDPSPTTEENEVLNEYYRRVSYSNANFKSFNEGWRSDMGMIYITLGPPNQVERNPMQVDSKPYEIWDYYNLNRRFVFVDETGFGDYRLLNPMYGDWYRYRQ